MGAKFKPSKHQQDIYKEIRIGTGNLLIGAVAGSGKTTTIVEALKLIPVHKKVIFLAFNKSIVEELIKRVPSRVKVSTLHSFGMRQCISYYGATFVNEIKSFKFIKPIIDREEKKLRELKGNSKEDNDWYLNFRKKRGSYMFIMLRLLDLFRMNLYINLEDIRKVNNHYNLGASDDVIKWTGEAIGKMRRYNKSNYDKRFHIDFTDMIYLPATNLKIPVDQYDYIFVDECQDLNRAQQDLLFRMRHKKTRVISVGDQYQSIYGFAGSDVESYNRLADYPNTKQLPLSVCYRCATSIIEKAQTIYDHIQPFEKAIEGEVRYDGFVDEIDGEDFVLCRNTAPLVSLYFELIRQGKKVFIKGRDIGENLLRELDGYGHLSTEDTKDALEENLDKLMQSLKDKGISRPQFHDTYIQAKEKFLVLQVFMNQYKTTNDVVDAIKKLFRDEGSGIVLSTIHKSKGLEARRVFVIREDLLPSQFAVKDWQKAQEKNLEYVMITRAQEELIYIPTYHWTNDDKN